jgi:hypothetical protein
MDLYYYDGETSKRQAFSTTQNTKYIQQFANLTGGSSVFTIPPQNGIQDIVLELVAPDLSGAGNAADLSGIALPRGWGYAAIKQVSFRYGGSSTYFLTGDQILQNALRRQPSRTTAEDLLNLGGAFINGTGGVVNANLDAQAFAAVVLTLPHNSPSGVGKSHPLPTDLLTQQVQITVELNPLRSIYSVNTTNANAVAIVASNAKTASYANAQFVVQQVMFNNQSDALARRVDMANNAYAYPCEFVQQIQRIALAESASAQSVVLTGFRSGEVKSIHCWLTRTSDVVPGNQVNPFKWYLPKDIQMSYAGDIYARYDFQSSPLWNLINGNKSPSFNNLTIGAVGTTEVAQSFLSQWTELPFAQTLVDEDSHYILSHGKPITNGIVNLLLTTPSEQTDWVLNVSYNYNATLLFSQGTCDYVF